MSDKEVKPIYLNRECDGRWRIHCPNCGWSNAFSIPQNAINKLSEHSLAKHHIRRMWPNGVPNLERGE